MGLFLDLEKDSLSKDPLVGYESKYRLMPFLGQSNGALYKYSTADFKFLDCFLIQENVGKVLLSSYTTTSLPSFISFDANYGYLTVSSSAGAYG
jgi:hypothetical protein